MDICINMGRQTEFNKKYIVLEDENFEWDEVNIKKFREMWNADVDFFEICRALKRKQIQVALLILDQAQAGHIKKREIGLGIRGFIF